MSLYQYIRKTNIGQDYPNKDLVYVNQKYQYLNGEDYFCSAKERRKLDAIMYQYPDSAYRAIYNMEQDCLNPKCRYLSSEGRHHCDIEQDYSNPKYMDWGMRSPTFIIQNITVDTEGLHDYITRLLNEHDAQFADQITNIVIERVQNQIDSSVEESIAAAFAEIGVISEAEIDDIVEN